MSGQRRDRGIQRAHATRTNGSSPREHFAFGALATVGTDRGLCIFRGGWFPRIRFSVHTAAFFSAETLALARLAKDRRPSSD
jgi:hypothetical protein